jgi:DNA modification methylase
MVELKILTGNCKNVLKTLPDKSIQTCVTSPPYYQLRDYQGEPDQLGQEPTPQEYISKLVEIFREVKRVLRDDGTVWINIGDSYAGSGKGRFGDGTPASSKGSKQATNKGSMEGIIRPPKIIHGVKRKELIGIPWRLAIALSDDGWYLRSDIIWNKTNAMPSSVKDRPNTSHEYVFLLSKNAKYFYDSEAVKEESSDKLIKGKKKPLRNKRTVWNIPTAGHKSKHCAVFPTKLVEPCVLAGTSPEACGVCGSPYKRVVNSVSLERHQLPVTDARYRPARYVGKYTELKGEGGDGMRYNITETIGWTPTCKCEDAPVGHSVVLDPFCGEATTGVVCKQLGRSFIGIELNDEYAMDGYERILNTIY